MASAKKKDSEETAKFLDNFSEFLASAEAQSLEDLRRELLAEGVDVDKVTKNVKEMVQAKLSEAKRAWLKESPVKRRAMLDKINVMVSEVPLSIEEIKSKLAEIVSGGERQRLALSFRNFDRMTDDDLRKLYADYIKLQSMKKEIDDKKA